MIIEYEFNTEFGVFRDAIHLTDEEASTITSEEIEQIKQDRLNDWFSVLKA